MLSLTSSAKEAHEAVVLHIVRVYEKSLDANKSLFKTDSCTLFLNNKKTISPVYQAHMQIPPSNWPRHVERAVATSIVADF